METPAVMSRDSGINGSAIVTGAASGIGRAVARELVRCGSGVCLVDLSPMDDLVDELAALGGSAIAVQGDTSERATMRNAVRAAQALGVVDTAVLNAGVLSGESDITKIGDDRYERIVGANIDGVFRGLSEFVGAVGRSPARVVVTNSSVGLVPAPHDPVYAMSKHAVIGLVRSLALNPSLANIKINCICPNGVDTPMLGQGFKAGRALLRPADVAMRIVELLDDEQSGRAWVCTPTKFEPFDFPPNPGYSFPTFLAREA